MISEKTNCFLHQIHLPPFLGRSIHIIIPFTTITTFCPAAGSATILVGVATAIVDFPRAKKVPRNQSKRKCGWKIWIADQRFFTSSDGLIDAWSGRACTFKTSHFNRTGSWITCEGEIVWMLWLVWIQGELPWEHLEGGWPDLIYMPFVYLLVVTSLESKRF